jgi:hypothetical protein
VTAVNDKDLNALGCFVTVLAFPAFIVGNLLLEGHVLNQLWGWFLTPVSGVSPPGWAICAGLSTLLGVARLKPDWSKQEESSLGLVWGRMIGHLAGILLMWGIGYLIHLCAVNGVLA